MNSLIPSVLAKLADRKNLTFEETRASVEEIFLGSVSPVLVAGFLVALRTKGETVDEIAGAVSAMRAAVVRISLPGVVVDTCGTGGDRTGSFNVSTATAFVVAGAGVTVAKHGNRSVSSRCGSADVLEALGVRVDAPATVVERCLKEVGIGFLFAPHFHPALRHVMPVRRELGLRTLFNILGPLTNPAGANAQVIGVFSPDLVPVVAQVLQRLGDKNVWVVHSRGHDEITLSGPTKTGELRNGRYRTRVLTPKDFGFSVQKKPSLAGGDSLANAEILKRILAGEPGPNADVVVANAAAVLWVAEAAGAGLKIKNFKDAKKLAMASIQSGAAQKKLNDLISLSNVQP